MKINTAKNSQHHSYRSYLLVTFFSKQSLCTTTQEKLRAYCPNIHTVLCFNGQKEETNKVWQIIEFTGDFQETIQGNNVQQRLEIRGL